MSNKTEIIYDLVFKFIIRILNQNKIYTLEIRTITIVTEIALINSVKRNFRQIIIICLEFIKF